MRFENITIHNFLSIKEAGIDLADRGLVLIEGVNKDDPSARSNGAGKSSIVDALSWCLYGKTARGVSGGDVVNKKAGKDCSVSVTLVDGSTKYCIVRERKSASVGKLSVNVIVEEKGALSVCVDQSKGTMAETQKDIEEIIGCPYEVFVATVYAGQEAMPDIPNMTDKQLKALIESVIGVEKLSNAYQKVLDESNNAEKDYISAEAQLRTSESAISMTENALNEAKSRRDNWMDSIKSRLNSEYAEFDEIKNAYKSKKEELSNLEEKKAKAEEAITNIENKLSILEKIQAKLSAEQERINELNRNLWQAETSYKTAESEREKSLYEIANIDSKVGTRCSECGKVYTASDLKDALEQTRAKSLKLANDCVQKRSEYDSAKDTYERAVAAFKGVQEGIPDAKTLYAQREEQKAIILDFERNENALANLQKEMENRMNRVKELKVEMASASNPYESEIVSLESKIEDLEKQKAENAQKFERCQQKIDLYKELKKVFGKEGVRQHVLDTITPVLNDRTARYLHALSDGKLSAVWTTLSATKKGEVKENFNIKVSNSAGGNSFASLSGGEKRKVRVACCLALQELVASRATKPIELFVADEVDHALDDAGVERLIGVLNEKAKSCKTLLVISHNPLRNWIDNVIQVVKKDGYSTIE